MIHLATLTTHTTGVNWQAVAAIAGPVLTMVGAVARWVGRKIERVIAELQELNERQAKQSERIARLEGPMRRIETRNGL